MASWVLSAKCGVAFFLGKIGKQTGFLGCGSSEKLCVCKKCRDSCVSLQLQRRFKHKCYILEFSAAEAQNEAWSKRSYSFYPVHDQLWVSISVVENLMTHTWTKTSEQCRPWPGLLFTKTIVTKLCCLEAECWVQNQLTASQRVGQLWKNDLPNSGICLA